VALSAPAQPRFDVRLHLRNTPREVLLQDLQRVARQSGERSPTTTIYDEHGRVTSRALIHRFGSWNGALAAAGLPIRKNYRIAETDLFENLVQLWRKLGRQPLSTELSKKAGLSRYSTTAYLGRFGTWNKALQAFDAYINRGKAPKERTGKKPRHARTKARSRRISWRLRATVLLSDNCACRMCGASPAKDSAVTLHVDHIKPWSKGGATALDNLQTLCSACNIGKSDRLCAQRKPKRSRPCFGRRRRSRPKRKP
jgi:5-methylcytosine-specific restriction endonuclease McrA